MQPTKTASQLDPPSFDDRSKLWNQMGCLLGIFTMIFKIHTGQSYRLQPYMTTFINIDNIPALNINRWAYINV